MTSRERRMRGLTEFRVRLDAAKEAHALALLERCAAGEIVELEPWSYAQARDLFECTHPKAKARRQARNRRRNTRRQLLERKIIV